MATPALPQHPPQPPVVDFGRILLAFVVMGVGILFLLEATGTLDASDTIGEWWPAVVIAAGVLQYFEHSRPVVQPLLLIAAGVLLLLATTEALGSESWDYVWPVAVIAGGLLILSRRSGLGRAGADDGNTLVATGIFGGPDVASTSQNFRGASLTAVFGGVTLDLRGARPAPEGAAITATCAFGGIDILVPHGWRIAIRTTPIFGGVSDKTDHTESLPEDAPVLRIDALTVFGGLDVKHKRD